MAASRQFSVTSESHLIVFFQMLSFNVNERQSSSTTLFFPDVKITGTKDVSIASKSFFIFFIESKL